MHIISKRFATGILGTILSVIPMTQAGAQKAATSSTKFHSSKVLAAAGEHLKGATKDTYNASKKFSATSSKKTTKTNSGNQFIGIKSLVKAPTVAPRGAVVIGANQEAMFYALNKKAFSNLLGDVRNRLDTAGIMEIKVKVPKAQPNGAKSFHDILSNCLFQIKYNTKWHKDVKGNGVESKVTKFTGYGQNINIEFETLHHPDGSSDHRTFFSKLVNAPDGTSNEKIQAGNASVDRWDTHERYVDETNYVFDSELNRYKLADRSERQKSTSDIMRPVDDLYELEIPKSPEAQLAEEQLIQQTQIMMQRQTMMNQNQLMQQQMINQQSDLLNTLDQQRRNLDTKQIQQTIQHNINNANADNAPTYGTR